MKKQYNILMRKDNYRLKRIFFMAFIFLPSSYAVSDEQIVYIDDEISTKDWAVTIYDRGDFLLRVKMENKK